MKTATIYARVSSTGDRQDTARQVEDLHHSLHYDLIKYIIDIWGEERIGG